MHIRFKTGLTSSILLIIALITVAMFSSLWIVGKKSAQENALQLFETVSSTVQSKVHELIHQSLILSDVISQTPQLALNEADNDKSLALFYTLLEDNRDIYSTYFGREDGSFFQVIAARGNSKIIQRLDAPSNTYWIKRTISESQEGHRTQEWVFLDQDRIEIAKRFEDKDVNYDPRQRPWYVSAMRSNKAEFSDVYIYNSSQEPGLTASRKLLSGQGVFGIDLTLSGLTSFLDQQTISENGFAFIYDRKNRLITRPSHFESAQYLDPISSLHLSILDYPPYEQNQKISTNGINFLQLKSVSEQIPGLKVAVVAPTTDFQKGFAALQKQLIILLVVCLVIFIPIAVIYSERLSHRLVDLADESEAIGHLDFSKRERKPSFIIEFNQLENSFESMRKALEAKTDALSMVKDKLDLLVELGIAMSAERDNKKVMEMLLRGARELSNADGGTLYQIEDDKLAFKVVHNCSLDIFMGGTSGFDVNLPPVALWDEEGQANHKNVVSHCVHEQVSINIADAYNDDRFDFSGTKKFDEMNSYRSQSFLSIPLKPRGGEPIGALQIINAMDAEGNIIPFNPKFQPFIESLAAQAATVIYNRTLLKQQEQLMDAMIELIAGAIDAKSPYTGGHCARVPQLAEMLAKEASDSTHSIFGDFAFTTPEQWREFKIGAWLHDCGKVITPEYVIDKATKLETIYNRIHEIRTRFEVLYRDAQIEYLKKVHDGGDETKLKVELEERFSQLKDDFAFICTCNVGGEFLADEKIARLEELAKQTWTRYFDINQGLSFEERTHYENVPAAPCEEKLLDDKSYHIIPRDSNVKDVYEYLNFTTPVPEHLYNRGELYNLRVARGTLTNEEHFKIKEHIMQTIAMLERLPLPAHLKRVPEYAGTHHETMIGTGYPRSLSAEDLSVPSRIMALCDIFEALTASDRPYKQAKSLSESIKILSFFKKDGHIDPDVFDLFLTSGVYKDYANMFLLPEQIDEVDITQYLN